MADGVRELISFNQMKGLRRSHRAERKIQVKEDPGFREEPGGPALNKGHPTLRT